MPTKLEALGADPALTAMAWRLAAVYGTTKPKVAKKAVVLFAGDHAIDGGENVTKGKIVRLMRWKSQRAEASSTK